MSKRTLAGLVLSLLLLAGSAQARPDAKASWAGSRPDLLHAMLADLDLIVTVEMMDRVAEHLGPAETLARLEAIALDEALPRYVRLRAVGTLPYFATPAVRRLLEQIANEADDPELRIEAVVTLGRAFYAADPEGVGAWLRAVELTAGRRLSDAAQRTLRALGATAR